MLDGRLRATVTRGLNPIGRGLLNLGVGPDVLTLTGLALSIATALFVASGHLVWGVIGLTLSGLVDLLDGSVARTSGRVSSRGAFFDSVIDRASDAVVFGGVAWYLGRDSGRLPVLALTAVALAMLISYERAKAEGFGYNARGGLMERAERMVMLGIGLAFDVLVPVLWIMVALMAVTAVHRFLMVWKQATADLPARPPAATGRHRRARTGESDAPVSRWRSMDRPAGRRAVRTTRRSRP
ncbi:MAG: CDP-alcohol phosphatidyltransferase family protein [Acidimicrobiia bacterium]|nr:CDP-alcohol phosphatidyltransferase family protein [Acidimicrobiia bacterium]